MLNLESDRKHLLHSTLLCVLLALLSLGWCLVQGHGAFTVVDDFNLQQIPFSIGLHNALADGGISGWSWNIDLGTATLTGYSFYALGSPFFWLSLLFPAQAFPWLTAWIYMLKYAAAGAAAFLYLSLFLRDRRWAVAGAVLYAFSGFSTINLEFYHFHDVIAVFPLLLYGLERCMEDRRDWPYFAAAVFLSALVNYFFFVMEVVFLLLYFLCRFWTRDLRTLLRRILLCLGCGALGAGMSAVILLPSVLYILKGTRGSADLFYIDAVVYEARRFLYIVKGFLLPAEAMCDQNSVYQAEWSSTCCYLPFVGMSFVFAYMQENKGWLTRLLWVLLVISFSPLLTCGFLLFTGTYQRWWFMLVLIMALASALAAENADRRALRQGALRYLLMLGVYCAMLLFMRSYEEEGGLVFHRVRFLAYSALAFSGPLGILLYEKLPGRRPERFRPLLAGICICAVVSTAATLYFYRASDAGTETHLQRYRLGAQLELPEPQYRLRSDDNELLFTGRAIGTGAFTSTVSNSIWEFDALFDYYNNIVRLDKGSIPGLNELLGAGYRLSETTDGKAPVRTWTAGGRTWYLLEEDACPIGFAADGYLLESELISLPVEQRAIALLDSIVTDEAGAALVGACIPHSVPTEEALARPVGEYTAECRARAAADFERNGKGFSCLAETPHDTLFYFSVPWDEGWTAFVDGEETSILRSGGMMAIPVPAGEHQIRFSYTVPGYRAGLALSGLSAALFLGLLISRRKRGKAGAGPSYKKGVQPYAEPASN